MPGSHFLNYTYSNAADIFCAMVVQPPMHAEGTPKTKIHNSMIIFSENMTDREESIKPFLSIKF